MDGETRPEKRKPWGKWYWGDWRKDARLRRCSYAARGLWADMLSLMGGECDYFGCLIMEGEPLGAEDLEGLLGGSAREIQKLIDDLERRRVFSRVCDEDIPDDVRAFIPADIPRSTIISRRMLRDKARDENDRRVGSKGGNPNLTKKTADRLTGEPGFGLTPPDNAQRLEARDQRLEARKDHSRSSRETAADLGFDRFYDIYPKHEARGAAEQAFLKARKIATLEELIAGAERYAARADQRENGRYVALPATWLNQKRWLDEPAGEGLNGSSPVSERRKPRLSLEEAEREQGLTGEIH